MFKPFRFIDKHEIECRALNILEGMARSPKYNLTFPLDSSRVAEFLGLDVVWDSIPSDEEGQIAARILPLERLIEINDEIPQLQSGFGESTIAHEIGHWVLHIDIAAADRLSRLHAKGVRIATGPLLCRSASHLEGMEWQAQYFASCLLMPQFALHSRCEGRDLTRWPTLYAIAQEFGVTISNLVHRLKDLNWIEIPPNSRTIYRKQLDVA